MAVLGRVEGVGWVSAGLVNDGDDGMNGLTSSTYAENRLVGCETGWWSLLVRDQKTGAANRNPARSPNEYE